jgi:hypothetical protein
MKSRLQNGYGILLILSFFGYAIFSSLSRKLFLDNLITYTILFALFYGMYRILKTTEAKQSWNLPGWSRKWWRISPVATVILLSGIALRLIFLWDVPSLSQDFYRFIWDGHLLLNGYNPYLYTPDELIAQGIEFIPDAKFLHASMGTLSSGHYTNYPPLNQALFSIAAFLGGDSLLMNIVWMRTIIILADVVIFLVALRLLQLMGKPATLIALYFLNPFVIIELTGNLHWEGLMACLMLIGIYQFVTYQRWRSPVFLGLGILLKLMPLIALPLLLKGLRWRRLIPFFGVLLTVVLLGFAPFVSGELLDKYASSVGLWFGKFEFNASVYYIVRAIGFEVTGYNIIGVAAKVLPVITIVGISALSIFRKNQYPFTLFSSIVFGFTIYLLMSTTVHPWYLTIPLLFSVFTQYRFMMVWSFVVFLSYAAYSNPEYQENLWLVAVEYTLVLGFFIFEILNARKHDSLMPVS